MKISDTNGSVMRGLNGPNVGKSKGKSSAFRDVMNQIMDQGGGKSAEPSPAGPAASSLNVTPGQVIGKVEGQFGISSGTTVMKEVESALDLAEFYSKKLGDPALSAASLEPLVDHLEEKMASIRFHKDHGELNQEVKAIISDLDLVVGTEVARFRRGDYS